MMELLKSEVRESISAELGIGSEKLDAGTNVFLFVIE